MKKLSGLLSLMALFICLSVGAMACELAPVRPAIHIELLEIPVSFDASKSMERLRGMVSSYHTDVSGVMSGDIEVKHVMAFHKEKLGDKGCVSLGEINITIIISPTIYIANDFQDKACRFKNIFIHEARHVEIDRALMKKYVGRFTDGLNLALTEPGDYSSGWVEVSSVSDAQLEMRAGVEGALEALFNIMMSERQEKQLEFDSEYIPIARACQNASS